MSQLSPGYELKCLLEKLDARKHLDRDIDAIMAKLAPLFPDKGDPTYLVIGPYHASGRVMVYRNGAELVVEPIAFTHASDLSWPEAAENFIPAEAVTAIDGESA